MGRHRYSLGVRGNPVPDVRPAAPRVPELLGDAARWGTRPHLIQGTRTLTFDDCFAAIDAVSAHLLELGVAPGDRILILAPNSPEWVISLWAGVAVGAIVAPGNGWWSEEEVAHALDLVEPSRRGSRCQTPRYAPGRYENHRR